MSKKIITRILMALTLYAIFVVLVMTFYDDSPAKMQWNDREEYNSQFIGKLKLEKFTLDQAIQELGSPDITEAKRVEQINYQVMFYRTQHVKSDGITTQDECTALLFKNGLLNGIGGSAYQTFLSM